MNKNRILFSTYAILSVLAFLIVVVLMHSADVKISDKNKQLANISQKIEDEKLNLVLNSVQFSKISALQQDYLILESLNSSHKEESYNIFESAIKSNIYALSKGNISYQDMSNLSLENLNNLAKEQEKKWRYGANSYIENKKYLDSELIELTEKKEFYYIAYILFQSFAMFFGLCMGFIEQGKKH